jgi:predicted 2-oxoglutarate/Fe(II)-dependent dioxygenase YbiX
MHQSQAILYPIPILTRKLPSHVYRRGLLSPHECDQLVALADRKGYQHFEQSRYGEAGAVQVEVCEVTPDDAVFVYEKMAATAAELNQEHWQLSLTGIAEPFRVLRYFDGYWTRPHVDRDYRLADSSKLSCIMQLVPSDDFAGGVLTVAETDAVSLGQGDAVFFPAHEIHTVSEVTRGTRIVLAGWVHGPVLR